MSLVAYRLLKRDINCPASFRYWPLADIVSCTANVRFWGQSRHNDWQMSAFAVAIGGKADMGECAALGQRYTGSFWVNAAG
jgi:hypothetical protein